MNSFGELKGLEQRVKRLEAAVGKGGKNCPHCRLHLAVRWSDTIRRRPKRADELLAVCELCHSEYLTSTKGIPKEDEEIYKLMASCATEEYYTNPKAYALYLWLSYKPTRAEAVAQNKDIKEQAKSNPRARKFVKIEAEWDRALARRHRKQHNKYKQGLFPEQTALVESLKKRPGREPGVHVPNLKELEREETCHLIRAELEKIILSGTRPTTVAALEDVRVRIATEVEAATQRERQAEEQRVRREEEWRRQNEARLRREPASAAEHVDEKPASQAAPLGHETLWRKVIDDYQRLHNLNLEEAITTDRLD
jgi:hypothetical protein